MNRQWRGVAVASLAIAAVVTMALTASGAAPTANPIKIGVIGAMTGGGAAYGLNMKQGAEMAVEEINADGGINGRKLELVVVDDAADPAQSVTAMIKLISEMKVDVIVGGWGSSTVLANQKVAEKEGVPYISVGGSNPQITRKENHWHFRNLQTDAIQGREIADVAATDLGKKRLAIIHDSNDYGSGSRDVFTARLNELGLKPVSVVSFKMGDKDFSAQILKMREANPDGVAIFGTLAEAAPIAKQMRQLGLKTQPIFGTASLSNTVYLKNAGAAAMPTYALTPFNTLADPRSADFAKKYVAKYKGETVIAAPEASYIEYEAIKLILAPALKKAGTTEKAKVRDAIRTQRWQGYGQSVENYFDETGQAVRKSIVIYTKNGDYVPYKK